jgi:hypothetical protein
VNSQDARAPEYKAADRRTQDQPVIPAERTRQAVKGHNARYVLGFSLLAIIVAFAIVYAVYFI